MLTAGHESRTLGSNGIWHRMNGHVPCLEYKFDIVEERDWKNTTVVATPTMSKSSKSNSRLCKPKTMKKWQREDEEQRGRLGREAELQKEAEEILRLEREQEERACHQRDEKEAQTRMREVEKVVVVKPLKGVC